MDLILQVADHIVLDNLYAKFVPVAAFLPPPTINGTIWEHSTWQHLASYLPHPPFPYEVYRSYPEQFLAPASAWPRDYIPRQCLSLIITTLVGVHLLYFIFSTFSYYFVFDHAMMKHPRFLKNQVRQEITMSLQSFPVMMLLTLPWFEGEVLGYSKLYDNIDEYGWAWFFLSIPAYAVFSTFSASLTSFLNSNSIFRFLVFTDYCIYWIHRLEHHPRIYKHVHKPHHKWIIPTPFAAYAFHPVDGYLQSLPYHIFPYLFPVQKHLHLALFVGVNVWTVFIHDSDMITGHWLENIINGPAHHTLHHLYFTVNYGQYFTWADKAGGSYRQPDSSLDPMLEVKGLQAEKETVSPGKSL